ncbi:ferritin-like domain-containing protein [Polluticoccus soli]|uniref:ferritin-like domain-containing protein n=1 Tax=Polluticoccus soli TaxID=3034150 RepID=UPI0023E2F9CF|nr:ferritin-like domain-containing protein [Flavipsychrobacter sp. JY13-12]
MKEELKETSAIAQKDLSRRQFLSYAGLAGAGLVIASCNKDDDGPEPADGSVDLGSEDWGLLNYMFALKQLSAAFYTGFAARLNPDGPIAESQQIPEMRDHEIAHRELLRDMLGTKVIEDFQFFLDNKVEFTNREAALGAARDIEQALISGFLGIAGRFASAQYLEQIAKMMSVNGRHLGYVNDGLAPNDFAHGLNAEQMDVAKTPEQVLASLSKYYPKEISTKHIPKQ